MAAGKITRDWFDGALCNVTGGTREIAGWFAIAGNFRDVCFGDDLSLWADGQWIDQAAIDALCARVDAGV
jgi:hypothetical protein